MNKSEIRRPMLKARDSLQDREKLDKIIIDKLINSDIYKNSKNIFIYLGFGSEIDTFNYIDIFMNDGKKIIIPYTDVKNKRMYAIEINNLDGLNKNKFGILEPIDVSNIFNKEDIELVIVPGVAFDRSGNRIGYGGGYYDKFFSEMKKDIQTIALAYDIQIIDKIHSEEHDKKVNNIITEKEFIKCLKK